MKIRVKIFAGLRDALGFDEKELIVSDGITAESVFRMILKCAGHAYDITAVLFAVNEEYGSGETILSDGDILAIFPPVSGG
ncbi:MAG: MoaD/ThiS family protein [Spirochaetes bacterium]|jgi:molybdopterin synthase sulfur carrier subunit|nr:MoaD/ThiS family protein [Spirochaetota bacterium]